jgi:outer membrane lipoprotein-sorting protein
LSKYNRDENRYQTYEVDNPEDLSGSHIEPTLLGSSPLENFELTYEGMETVATRDTHHLSFQPKESANAFNQRYNYIQMWIDEEYWIPIKQDAEYQLEEETLRETKVFESIEFDNIIEESVFRFDPPEGAKRAD